MHLEVVAAAVGSVAMEVAAVGSVAMEVAMEVEDAEDVEADVAAKSYFSLYTKRHPFVTRVATLCFPPYHNGWTDPSLF